MGPIPLIATLADYNAQTLAKIDTIARGLREENAVRRELVDAGTERKELRNYTETQSSLMRLAALQIQNDSGRILSSGHFPNEFDRVDATLPAALRSAPGSSAIVRVRSASEPVLVLARMDTIRVGSRLLTVIGGTPVREAEMRKFAPERGISLALSVGDSLAISTGDSAVMMHVEGATDSIGMPYIDATGDSARSGIARLVITQSTEELDAAVRDVRSWIIGTIVVAIIAALAVALWLASWLSNPLTELASESARMDLNNPRIQFSSAKREDEIGTLARRLVDTCRRIGAGIAASGARFPFLG